MVSQKIGENITTISDSIQYAEIRKLTDMFLFRDFEKAFDFLEWKFLLIVLKATNFELVGISFDLDIKMMIAKNLSENLLK